MVRTEKRIRICVVLLIVNIAFIWGNSLLPGRISGALSNGLKSLLELIFGSGEGEGSGGGFLRKVAHFTEFTCLGLCFSWLFGMLKKKPWLPLCCGVAVACLDETIQLFVPDRGPGIKDVGIDTLGVILGIFIISLITHIKKNKQKETVL